MVYKFFDKRSKGSSVANNEIKQNLQLAEKEKEKEKFILDLDIIIGVLI